MTKKVSIPEFVILAAVILCVGAWYLWQANKTENVNNPPANPGVMSKSNDRNVFKIQDLGVEFTAKDGITPLHFTQDWNYNNVNYKLIEFSTQQLVDKGAADNSDKTNPCEFKPSSDTTYFGHQILALRRYDSQSDLLKVEQENNSHLTANDIKPENGYMTLGTKLFYIPQNVERGSGNCIADGNFESQQRTLLRESLMTLRESK